MSEMLVDLSSSGPVMSSSNGTGLFQKSSSHHIEALPTAPTPPGFTRISLDDGNTYLVPKYLVPALLLQISKHTDTEDSDAVNHGVSSP